jgi:hypothetical protein
MRTVFHFLIPVLACMFSVTATAQDVNRSYLPIPQAPFKGKINLRPSQSIKDFPKEVQWTKRSAVPARFVVRRPSNCRNIVASLPGPA